MPTKSGFLLLAVFLPYAWDGAVANPKPALSRPPQTAAVRKEPARPARTSTERATMAEAVRRLLDRVEFYCVSAAEAMPEGKYDFSPESLHLPGTAFEGVRTFAGQIRHLATDNFHIWSPILGSEIRPDITDVNGPASIHTKAQLLQYLKESFALGHRAIESLTEQNALEKVEFWGDRIARLDLAFYGLTHSEDHYGQMVVYLRFCGIIPPASRP